jgi:hypothetical protein
MTLVGEMSPPRIEAISNGGFHRLIASLDMTPLSDLRGDVPWRMGISAVIEEKNGNISYWALAHPKGKPDFHHRDCFTLQIEASDRA